MAEFSVGLPRIVKLSADMFEEMKCGLLKTKSSLLMIPTYIHKVPNGEESGNVLALDFGGSTFRVILVKLLPRQKPVVKSSTISMDNKMKDVDGDELFDHIVECLSDFLQKEGLVGQQMPLGFTFSFPMTQLSLSHGVLVKWTKGFQNPGVIGQNVADLLNISLLRNKNTAKINVVALANDTAGTLVAGVMQHADCRASLILGTGTNAAYMEKVKNVPAMEECAEENVIINMEWGNFGEFGHLTDLQTTFDRDLDKASNNPGKQLFEKMMSGLYLGELVRLALLKQSRDKVLSFGGELPVSLTQENSFDGAVVSDCISTSDYVRALFPQATPADVTVIQEVCHAVSDRAAKLAAGGITAIWLKLNKAHLVIAVDGSVYLKHATFAASMKQALKDLGTDVELVVTSDGSGLGSALVAASVSGRT